VRAASRGKKGTEVIKSGGERASSYTVERTNTGTGAVVTLFSRPGTSGGDYTVPGTYRYSVKACNASGCSGSRNASNTTKVFCSTTTAIQGSMSPDTL
jgi:hypothetical protein